jgi:hypothetical protein
MNKKLSEELAQTVPDGKHQRRLADYVAPRLVCYGAMSELTRADGGDGGDGNGEATCVGSVCT